MRYIVSCFSFLTVPGEPINVRVEPVNSTAVRISWNAPFRPIGLIRGYRVFYRRLSTTTATDNVDEMLNYNNTLNLETVVEINDSQCSEHVVGRLQPDTNYQFRLAAVTRKTTGQMTRPRKVITGPAGHCYYILALCF